MSIVFNNVTKKIGRNIVINNISCNIEKGKITGFKGINGSGKTMLLRLIAGLIYPTSGTIEIDGKVLGKNIAFPESVGIMLENPAFINSYSGYDNLRMLADIKGLINEKEICEVMDLVGLSENGKKKYRKFSLGMKQRLGIAAAIMEKPEIILLDEPTNALDESGVELLTGIILKERNRGATIVISSHDAHFLNNVSNRIIEISNGAITKERNNYDI